MNDHMPPTDERPSEPELATLLTVGRERLGSVGDDRLVLIWRAVDDELDFEEPTVRTAVEGPGGPGVAVSTMGAGPAGSARATSVAAAPDGAALASSDPRVTSIADAPSRRRWSRFVPTAVAAAAALVVGVGAGLTLAPDPGEPVATTLATWELEPLGDAAVETAAAVLSEDAGVRTVELALADLPATDGFHEVWLLDPTTGALTSLGPVRPDGRYIVPSGTDLTSLTALDVSAEPLDGDPGHSGASLLRGEVTFVG